MRKALAGAEKNVLPIMPETAAALRKLLAQPNVTNNDLQAVLLSDPAASIALYNRIEQLRPGASESITDPAHAISMMGISAFKQLFEGLDVAQITQVTPLLSLAYGYGHAAHAAWLAKAMAEQVHSKSGNEIAAAALLQQPAMLALWHKDPESAARASNAVRDGVPFDVAFRAELCEPLSEANQRLAKAWGFPRLARESLGDWDPFNKQPQTVMLADLLTQVSNHGWLEEETALQIELLSKFNNSDTDTAAAWWRSELANAGRALHRFGYPPPVYELALLPGELEVEIPPLPSQQKTKPAAPPSLQQILGDLMRKMKANAHIERVAFIMLNKDRTELRTRMTLGGEKTDALHQLKISAKQRHLLALLMTKQQSIWLSPDNRSKYQPYLTGLPSDIADQESFYAMSLFVNGRPVGLLYADGGTATEPDYLRFRRICQQAMLALEGKG